MRPKSARKISRRTYKLYRRIKHQWPVWAFLACWLPQVGGQTVLTNKKVETVKVQHVGPMAVSDQMVLANIQTETGDTFSAARINQDVKNLLGTGYFYNVDVAWEVNENGVELVYAVQGKPKLTEIRFEGNERIKERRLRKKVTSKVGDPIDEKKLFSDARDLEEFYQKKGYQNTTVEYQPNIIEERGQGTVTFKVVEAPKVRIAEVNFVGATAFKQKKLRRVIKTRERWAFSWLTGSGVLKEDQFAEDQEKLRQHYWDNGFVDFAIKEIQYEHPEEDRMIINIHVFEGNQYLVGDLRVQGHTVYPTEEILFWASGKGPVERLGMNKGDVFTPQGLEENRQALEDLYEGDGYLTPKNQGETRIREIKTANTEKGSIDLDYQIDEGDQSYIEKIEIRGNTKTKDKVLRRELAVAPGEPFNMVRARLSQQRLEGLRYFESVELSVEPTDIPDRKNMVISVEERTTGNFVVGAGFNSIENLVAFTELSQGNFDLFKPPLFQGGGQKLRLRAQVGTRMQDYQLTFIEPWLMDRKLEYQHDLYHRELDYVSSVFDERRTGTQIGLRKTLGSDFIIGGVDYTVENIGIENVDPTASYFFRKQEGDFMVSKIGSSLSYDSRGGGFLPSSGQLTRLRSQLAGGPLGAEVDVYKLELTSKHYFKGLGSGHIIELLGEIGVADAYANTDTVPLFDRWWLGGLRNLRGFKFREVGPKDANDEPFGGSTYWFASAEYSIPIIERLRFAVFYDIGMVYQDPYSFDSNVVDPNPIRGGAPIGLDTGAYNDNFGFGIRLNLPIGPLRLDYGIPVTSDHVNDSGGRFNFGVGWERPF
ncbi:MAG: outer membrane protein assembly factor BamA [Verrucomicrobiota bacterium]|nr:outer membrane protein assembly factor BamA [Verrucomicrobiota bacterium]